MTPATNLWTRRRLAASLLADAIAASTLLVGWVQVSVAADVRDQLGWTALAIASLGIAGATSAQWILAGRRAVGLQLRAVLADPRLAPAQLAHSPEPAAGTPRPAVVATAAMTRFHTEHCPLAVGKATRRVTASTAQRRGLRPCDICEPAAS